MKHSIQQLIEATQGEWSLGDSNSTFESVSIDTRTLKPGDVFFAISGARFDGHAFLDAAAEKKASAAVVSKKFEGHSSLPLLRVEDPLAALQAWGAWLRQHSSAKVLAVLGSNGKTTTKQMLGSIMSLAGKTLITQGNLNNRIGLPMMLSRLEDDHVYAVLEMGTSEPGEIADLCRWAVPDIAVITNVGKDHLKCFKTMDGVVAENAVAMDALSENGRAVINLDDPYLKPYADKFSSRAVSFSIVGPASVSALDIHEAPLPLNFKLKIGDAESKVTLSVPGRFQVSNALAAAASAHAAGVPFETIVRGLEAFTPPPMRMQTITLPNGTILIHDAYNANPSSVRAAVESLCRSYPDRETWAVLGDMRDLGDIAADEHRSLGEWLTGQKLSAIYFYGRDMRWAEDAARAKNPKADVMRFQKQRWLLEELKHNLTGKEVILFKASRALHLEHLISALSVKRLVQKPS